MVGITSRSFWLPRWHGEPGVRSPGARWVPVLAGALAGGVLWATGSHLLSAWQERQMPLPAVQVADLQGRTVDLQQFRGKPVVLNLWASCGPCRREMPVLASAQQTHTDVQFVFLNQGKAWTRGRVSLPPNGCGWTACCWTIAPPHQPYRVQAYPSTLFFDAEGRLRELHLGELTAAGLEHKLRRLR